MKRILTFFLLVVFCACVAALTQTKGEPVAAAAAGKTVTLTNFQFTPKLITVKAGSTVTWVNKEGTHSVNADDDSWSSPTLKAGQSFSHQFDTPGTFRYHCSFHGSAGGGNMAGTVRVIR
jgi:plastocyanin